MSDQREEELLIKHKKERKDLQSEIQKLKHEAPKGDKKRKKELQARVAQMEAELDARQKEELDSLAQGTSPTQSQAAGDSQPADEVESKLKNLTTEEADEEENAIHKGKKMSKAQRRREKKDQQAKEREERIKEQDEINVHGPRNREAQTLKDKLKQKSLAVYEIPSDGNCLYAAIAHQLSKRGIPSSVPSLRKQSADHMRQHADDFLPFLSQPDTGDPYTPEEFDKYLIDLEQTTAWGGQLEIRALSNVLRVPVNVVQAEGADMTLGEEFDDEALILTYHRHMYGLGEHYNSVIPLSEVVEEDEFS